jgi:hypothetical protein
MVAWFDDHKHILPGGLGSVSGFSVMPRKDTTWLLVPRQMVMVCLSDTVNGCSVGVLSGMVTLNAPGFCRLVVRIKKVMSRKARSTIAVRSTRVDSLLRGLLPVVFSDDEVSSAMILRIWLKNRLISLTGWDPVI